MNPFALFNGSYLLTAIIFFVSFVIYKLFLSFFVQYLIAGFKLGFDKIDMVYRPLSTIMGVYSNSFKKYRNSAGHIHQIIKRRPDVKIIFIRLLGTTQTMIVDPDYIRKLSFEFVSNLHKRQLLIFYQEIQYGLVFSQDQVWKNSRKLLSNLFHFNILQARANIMENVIEKQIRSLDKQKPNLFSLGCSIGGEIVLKSLFGQDFYNIDFDGRNPYEEINFLFRDLIMTSRGYANVIRIVLKQKATRHSRFLTQQQKKSLNRLINFKEKCKDFLRTQQKQYKNGKEVTQFLKVYFDLQKPNLQEVVQQLFLFLFAGQDTTGALISYCLDYLAKYPKYQKQIIEDVQQSGVHGSKILNNFISEVNRFCAPVQQSITRKVIKSFEIDGYTFKVGDILAFGYRNPMNNVKYWDEPQRFYPQRFQKPIQYPNAYTPFATGPRNCIGQHMALMEVRLTIARVLQKYILERIGDIDGIMNKGPVTLACNLETVRFNLKDNLQTTSK